MVRSINNNSSGSRGVDNQSRQSLRANFKTLSSGTKPSATAAADNNVRVLPGSDRVAGNLGKLVQGLDEAVAHSRQALNSVDKIIRNPDSKAGSEEHDELTTELGKLRDEIKNTVEKLEARRERAEVLHENINSAGSKLQDIDRAQTEASSTVAQIGRNSEKATRAHRVPDPNRVSKLLTE